MSIDSNQIASEQAVLGCCPVHLKQPALDSPLGGGRVSSLEAQLANGTTIHGPRTLKAIHSTTCHVLESRHDIVTEIL